MREFESQVEQLKYFVLREVASLAREGKLEEYRNQIPYVIIKGNKAEYRCCVYRERAIVEQRVRLASGDVPIDVNVNTGNYGYTDLEEKKEGQCIFVIDSACEQCPINRYQINQACKGCMGHNCVKNCPKDAIKIVNKKACIDYEKCIECGRCKESCPFGAISEVYRPCTEACVINAIDTDEDKKAVIDKDRCNNCGECTKACPFGAIGEISEIVSVVNILKNEHKKDNAAANKKSNKKKNVSKNIAVISPSIIEQFSVPSIDIINSALLKLGFNEVYEASIGADKTLESEIEYFKENIDKLGCIASSHCTAFSNMLKMKYPELQCKISKTKSPTANTIEIIKDREKNNEVNIVIIGSCIAKKENKEDIKHINLNVLTYEELDVLFDVYGIEIEGVEGSALNPNNYGKFKDFEVIGELSKTINQTISKDNPDIEFNPIVCEGIEECIKILNLLRSGRLTANYIDGMQCEFGCAGGPAVISKNKAINKRLNQLINSCARL